MVARRLPLAVLAAALVLPVARATAQGQLLVVDAAGGPGSIATTIGDAVALAHDNDTLLVRAGEYPPFTIEARTLVVIAEPGAEVVVTDLAGPRGGPTILRGIAGGQTVVLEGLTLRNSGSMPFFDTMDALRVEQCDGQIWIQDCTLESLDGEPPPSYAALHVIDSHSVLVVRSDCHGVEVDWPAQSGGGLLAESSRVYAYESSFRGGPSAVGAFLDDSFLFAESTTLQGGKPTVLLGGPQGCQPIGAGGPGLYVLGTSQVQLLDSTYAGGIAEIPGCGTDGPPLLGPSSAVHAIEGPALSFSVGSPTIDGQPTSLVLEGLPGDLGLVLVALSLPQVAWIGKFQGALVTGTPVILMLGPLPPSGELVVPVDLGDALLSGTGSTIFLQGGVLHAGGGAQLGDPATLTTYEE